METVDAAAQTLGCAVKALTWGDCYFAAGQLWERIKADPPMYLYGVPRGGCTVAAMVQSLAHREGQTIIILDEPVSGHYTLVVDDLVDSGATLRRFVEAGHRVEALFRKPGSPTDIASAAIEQDGWLTFPWEVHEGSGAEDLVVRLLQYIGEDPMRNGLLETPKRVLKAWKELTAGYQQDPRVILNKSFEQPHDELILLRGIEFHSTCEHHLLPFYGTAAVGYIPTTSVVGISKLARLVDCFARRLQIQERLTQQIASAIQEVLNPLGVGVIIKAKHSCMGCRGVMKPDSDMVTSVMMGMLRENTAARAEFLSLVNL
jgi:GTP cyclohydrolase I